MEDDRNNPDPRQGVVEKYVLSDKVWQALILISSAAVLLFSVYCLSHGITIIFMHLYYFPIVLLTYRYRFRGLALATLLALAYVGLVVIFHPEQAEVLGAIYRFIVFIGIAVVVASLSERLASAHLFQKESLNTIQKMYQVLLSENVWRALILTSSAAVLLFSVYCLSHGITIIFMHLYYFPIVLLAYRYRYRGFALAILLSLAYVGLVVIFHPEQAEVTGAIYRFVVFIGIAAVVASLSERLAVVQLAQKQRLETIQNLQQFQESVITNANDWITVISLDGTIVVWNDAAETICGYKRDDVLGKRTIWKELYPDKAYRQKVTNEILRIIERDTYLENFETEIRCADGTQKTIVWNARGIHDVAGTKQGYITIGRESEERYRTLAEALPEQIFIVDRDDIMKYANPAALKLFRLPYNQVVGTSRKKIFPTDITDAQGILLKKVFETGEHVQTEEKIQFGTQQFWIDTGFVPLKDQTGHVTAVLGVSRDITERKKAEEELKISLAKYKVLFESLPIAITISDKLGNIVESNARAEEILGLSIEEQSKRKIDGTEWQLIRSDGTLIPADEYASVRALKENRLVQDVEMGFVKENSAVTWINVTAAPIPLKDYGVAIAYSDITERKRAEKALRASEERNRTVLENVPDLILVHRNGVIVYINPPCTDLTGYTYDELINKQMTDFIVPEYRPLVAQAISRRMDGEPIEPYEIEILTKSGGRRTVVVRGSLIEFTGSPASLNVLTDITERKAAEKAMRTFSEDLERKVIERTSDLGDANLKLVTEMDIRLDAEKQLIKTVGEKEVLLREVHHRVKNNLQIIISLLNLQSRYITDKTTLSAFKESQNRVRAMALVHEKLYQSTDLAKIDFDNYIRFLANSLLQFFGIKGKGITLTMDIKDIFLAIDTAIPLGLIINELISNSLKYAFPDERKGEISFAIHRQDHTLTILFRDNGVGIHEDFDWRNAESLGLRLVITLVEQLDGTIELDRTAGTAFTIVVKEKE